MTAEQPASLTDEQLEQHAFQILARELGLANYARFLRLFCASRTDYTATRHEWQSGITLEQIEQNLAAAATESTHRRLWSSPSSAKSSVSTPNRSAPPAAPPSFLSSRRDLLLASLDLDQDDKVAAAITIPPKTPNQPPKQGR